VRNQALPPPLRPAALGGPVALPLVCVAGPCSALRLNRDLLAEELDLIKELQNLELESYSGRDQKGESLR
jgi:hypothetical protein